MTRWIRRSASKGLRRSRRLPRRLHQPLRSLPGKDRKAMVRLRVQRALHWTQVWRSPPESRCSPYDRDDYPYSPAVEARILKRDGGVIRCRYTGQTFASLKGTDIEHVVALSEAHDSGLCAAPDSTRRAFAGDLNLVLAAPRVEPRAGRTAGESIREEGQGRRRVATGSGSMLVRRPSRARESQVWPHRRSAGTGRPGEDSHRLREGAVYSMGILIITPDFFLRWMLTGVARVSVEWGRRTVRPDYEDVHILYCYSPNRSQLTFTVPFT